VDCAISNSQVVRRPPRFRMLGGLSAVRVGVYYAGRRPE